MDNLYTRCAWAGGTTEFSVPPGNVRTQLRILLMVAYGEITEFPNLRNFYENHYVQIVFCVTSFPYLRRNYCSFPTYLIFTRIITCINSFRIIKTYLQTDSQTDGRINLGGAG